MMEKRKIKVMFVADGDFKYGAAHSLFDMIEAIMREREDICVCVVLTDDHLDWYFKFRQIGCEVYKSKYSPYIDVVSSNRVKMLIKYPLKAVRYFFGKMFALKILEKQVDLRKIDIVHSNSYREDFGVTISKKYNIPWICHIREFGDVDYNCYSYRKNYIEYMNKSASAFIAVSDKVKEHWIKRGIREEKIKRIYNIVRVSPSMKINTRNNIDKLKLLMVGSFSANKCHDQVLAAIARLPKSVKENISLDIVGDGNSFERNRIRKIVFDLGLQKNVKLLGYIDDYGVNIQGYDCGVICSKSEGFGRVTAEYMLNELPVIASDTGANPELVIDNYNGFLYEWNNIDNLKDVLLNVLGLKRKNKLQNIGKVAAREINEKINVSEIVSEITSLYKQVII